jgi:LCP family protein required for cell wall assembly
MAERPPGNGGPEEGTPEYDWLYGNRRRGSAGDDETQVIGGRQEQDATRRMPTVPRGEERASAPRQQPAPPSRPAPAPAGPPPPRARRRPRARLRWLWIALLLWLVYLVAVPIYAWTTVSTVDAEPPDGTRPDNQPGTNFLVVGSDSREGLSREERRELGTGNASGRRTDTIMVLHVGSGQNVLTSFPRDSIVDIPGRGQDKINAAFAYGGPKLLVRTMEQNTGLRIDHYVEIGFGGLVGLVDAVGGIEICPRMAMQDPQANLDIEEGCQEADGVTALGYARSRKLYQERGDVDRGRAQREVVAGIGAEVLSPWTVINPVRYWRVNTGAAESVRVSEGTGPVAMGRFAWGMTRVDGDSGISCTVPLADLAVNWDQERSSRYFQALIDGESDSIGRQLCTPTGFPRGQ